MQTTTHPETQPDTPDTFICPLCTQPLGFTLTPEQWEIMGNNNAFGHLWNDMLPRGFVFGRYIPMDQGAFHIEPIPRYLHVDMVHAYHYVPMHSRCYRAKRHEWVAAQQAACDHARATEFWRSRCPDCRKQLR
jgi:hypothetical protein